jgi:hypothetical protein
MNDTGKDRPMLKGRYHRVLNEWVKAKDGEEPEASQGDKRKIFLHHTHQECEKSLG